MRELASSLARGALLDQAAMALDGHACTTWRRRELEAAGASA
jgi:hypothetical protein